MSLERYTMYTVYQRGPTSDMFPLTSATATREPCGHTYSEMYTQRIYTLGPPPRARAIIARLYNLLVHTCTRSCTVSNEKLLTYSRARNCLISV